MIVNNVKCHVSIFKIHDVDLLCFDMEFVFWYVTLCCWNHPLRCTNVLLSLVKDTYVSTIWYTCSFDGPGQPPPKKKLQFLMSQAWKCVSLVCGIVTNHMHGDNLFGVVMLGGFNSIPWHPAGWVFCYSFTVDMENVPATNPVYIYIYINLFILVLSLKLRKFWGMPLAIYVEGNERHQGHNI